MPLHAETDGTGLPVVLVHGFTQTRECWGSLARDLAADHQVVRVDAPGHGRSADVVADLARGAELIRQAGGVATYVGYSMGARFCLQLAHQDPDRVRGLVLISGTAGIDDDRERRARREQDVETAQLIRDKGLPEFLDLWLQQPLFASLPADRAFREERLENTVEGLASSLEEAGTGAQDPSWQLLSRLAMPVLVLAGERDAKFSVLARRLTDEIGANATLAVIPAAGHAAHLEAPDKVLAVLRPWLVAHQL